MQTNLYSQSNYNTLDFSFKTSSGDKINLSMYDSKNFQYENLKTKHSNLQSLTLTHEYGYSFSYTGNGLDSNDIAEINKALKEIQPKIDEFMKNTNSGINFSNQEISNIANSLKSKLPEPKDLNHLNMISDKVLKMFDELLEQNKATKELLTKTNKLFNDLFNQTNKFSLYV